MASGASGSSTGAGMQVLSAPDRPRALYHALCDLLADRLPVAALAVDAEGTIVVSNEAAASHLDREASALVGLSLAEALGADAEVEQALARALAGEGHALTVPLPAADVPAATLSILPCRGDPPAGALVLVDGQPGMSADGDATHRLETLGRLWAGVAHEVRNPLSGIGTNAQVLRRRFDDDDPRTRFVDFILGEVNRLDKIIEDLLRFARPPEPRMVAHDLRDSIDKVLMLTRGRIDEQGVEVEVDVPAAPRRAWVDPDQVAQVLLNLVINALQAMPEGGRLGIRLREVAKLGPVVGAVGRRAGDRASPAPERRFLEIVIRDTGVGIAPADLPKLFEPFFTTRPSGTGLGLSTCRALIRQQGGAVSVDSELGRGTAVTVLIPVEKRRAPRS